jgi:shikimate kinase
MALPIAGSTYMTKVFSSLPKNIAHPLEVGITPFTVTIEESLFIYLIIHSHPSIRKKVINTVNQIAHEFNPSDQNLYLVGLMGCGKSTCAKLLSQRWNLPFLDTDEEIEKEQSCSISKMFEDQGELRFRQLEREYIEQKQPANGYILSCGGGLCIAEGMMELLKKKGLVVYLKASAETLHQRTNQGDHRPLLQKDGLTTLQTLLKQRQATYESAHLTLSAEGKTAEEVVEAIVARVSKEVS